MAKYAVRFTLKGEVLVDVDADSEEDAAGAAWIVAADLLESLTSSGAHEARFFAVADDLIEESTTLSS